MFPENPEILHFSWVPHLSPHTLRCWEALCCCWCSHFPQTGPCQSGNAPKAEQSWGWRDQEAMVRPRCSCVCSQGFLLQKRLLRAQAQLCGRLLGKINFKRPQETFSPHQGERL